MYLYFQEAFMSAKIMSGICFALLLAGCGGGNDIKFTPDPKPAPNLPSPTPQPGKMCIAM